MLPHFYIEEIVAQLNQAIAALSVVAYAVNGLL
jgi:hypothetical protein